MSQNTYKVVTKKWLALHLSKDIYPKSPQPNAAVANLPEQKPII